MEKGKGEDVGNKLKCQMNICYYLKLITLIFILITPDKSILFANPGVDQHLIVGINVGHVKGTGKRFWAVT